MNNQNLETNKYKVGDVAYCTRNNKIYGFCIYEVFKHYKGWNAEQYVYQVEGCPLGSKVKYDGEVFYIGENQIFSKLTNKYNVGDLVYARERWGHVTSIWYDEGSFYYDVDDYAINLDQEYLDWFDEDELSFEGDESTKPKPHISKNKDDIDDYTHNFNIGDVVYKPNDYPRCYRVSQILYDFGRKYYLVEPLPFGKDEGWGKSFRLVKEDYNGLIKK